MKRLFRSTMIIFIAFMIYLITPVHHTTRALRPYVDEFMGIAKSVCPHDRLFLPNKTVIRFGKPSEFEKYEKLLEVGYCKLSPFEYEIVINKEFFEQESEANKSQIMAHELTHCVLGEDHSDSDHDYMYPVQREGMTKAELDQQVLAHMEYDCADPR